MCAIAGLVGDCDPARVRQMCDMLAHRGPDGEGFYSDDKATLGMRRLSIVDVAGGEQPVRSENGRVVAVFDGELYNYLELREQLAARGHILRGEGDSECLVHLYEEYGDALVHHLRGTFAFAIWDQRQERLLLARDRLGNKPLYWRNAGTGLEFASELKAMEAPGEIDPVALHHYLTLGHVPAPWSIHRDVHKLAPGHLLTWQDGRARIASYWRLDCSVREPGGDPAETLRELLLEATGIRMVSDRPLGALLSGGIGSAAVVAAMARLGDQVKTFSIGFGDQGVDECEDARAVAAQYGTDHRELVIEPTDLAMLPELARVFDEPFADASAIPGHLLARMTAEHVTVALTGDGAAESFGGHERYALLERSARMSIPARLRPAFALVGSGIVGRTSARTLPGRVGRVAEVLGHDPAQRYARTMSCFTSEEKIGLYTPAFAERLAGVETYDLFQQAYDTSASIGLGRIMDVDVQTYLPGGLTRVDTTTMAHSLAARSPWLDHRLMEWAARLPVSYKVRSRTTERVLREAMRPWLPAEVIDRPKRGFGAPLASWLRADLKDLSHDLLTDSTATARGLFSPEAVEATLAEHAAGDDHSRKLWALIQFELWARARVPSRVVCRQG